jgi:2-polyprenyl-6-methoxyphenol hydroxylase-like FAD-dependent oxidoreductase
MRRLDELGHEVTLHGGQHFASPQASFSQLPNPGVNQDIIPGRRRYYFVWYRPIDYESTLPDLCTDVTGRRHGVAIPPPPPLIRPEFHPRPQGERRIAACVVAQTEQPLLQAVFDLESPQLIFGRVVLLGDAAFVARPHVVAGVTKAACRPSARARA